MAVAAGGDSCAAAEGSGTPGSRNRFLDPEHPASVAPIRSATTLRVCRCVGPSEPSRLDLNFPLLMLP